MTAKAMADKIMEIIWDEVFVWDDSGLHFGQAEKLIEEFLLTQKGDYNERKD